MVGLYEATKTPQNCYRVGLNCRVRENAIIGAYKPVRIDTPNAIHQAVFAFDDQLLVVIAGSTYKLRSGAYFFRGARAFPSYLQAGPGFYIEKSKRSMIADDIRSAMALLP